jgi:hypothetical protein
MRIVQLRKSRLFKLVAAALCVIPLIYILFLQSSHENIKFSAFSSKNVKIVSLNEFKLVMFSNFTECLLYHCHSILTSTRLIL